MSQIASFYLLKDDRRQELSSGDCSGAVLNWNWLCDPIGASHSQLFGRKVRRIIFGSAGAVLIVVGIAMFWF